MERLFKSWTEIGQRAAIIVLRTVLNCCLQREIERAAVCEGVEARVRAEARRGPAVADGD
ncbi:MAG TPA: DUF1622 domain-containing protein [Thermomicrobiaceae bacterium]|nr:DUF1622 domain-containing protein [Thermomicrobiaceae bacterium]